jgi:hypothetical protein
LLKSGSSAIDTEFFQDSKSWDLENISALELAFGKVRILIEICDFRVPNILGFPEED